MLIGVVDSGIPMQSDHTGDQSSLLVEGCNFSLNNQDCLRIDEGVEDRLNHGTLVVQTLENYVQRPRLCVARVFDRHLATSALQVAAAIDWLVCQRSAGQRVSVINLSLGLRQDRDCLRQACDRAIQAGIVLVASSPAHGEPVYPSAYADVIRVTGDARCDRGEFAYLNSAQATFGASVRSVDGVPVGASMATAHVTGKLVQLANNFGGDISAAVTQLRHSAQYQGADLTPYQQI